MNILHINIILGFRRSRKAQIHLNIKYFVSTKSVDNVVIINKKYSLCLQINLYTRKL